MVEALKIAIERRSPVTIFVGLVLWQQLKMKKSQPLRVSQTVWGKFDLERRTVSRAVAALESAGLATVKRFKHRSPEITIATDATSKS
jgi:DNA-binding transcriptional ArsR family regulator